MSVGTNIWDALYRLVLWLLAVAAVVAVIIWYVPKIQQNESMRREIYTLERRLESEQEQSRQHDARLRSLQDARTVEKLARERLSFAKPGEIIFRFEAPKAVEGGR
jgi:cell division protein FtsB